MYSSQGLKGKNLKSKLEWLLVRNVVDHESVVQKNRIKTLQRHRQTLEQKWWRSLLTRKTAIIIIIISIIINTETTRRTYRLWQAISANNKNTPTATPSATPILMTTSKPVCTQQSVTSPRLSSSLLQTAIGFCNKAYSLRLYEESALLTHQETLPQCSSLLLWKLRPGWLLTTVCPYAY